MPEATMHKNDSAASGKNDVRLSGQILAPKGEPKSETVQD
jgi:hypothetical protein